MRRSCSLCALLLVAAACGGSASDGNPPDAGPGSCQMAMSFSPTQPEAGMSVVVTASIDSSGLYGPKDYTWTVRLGTEVVAHTTRNADGSEIEIAAATAGSYRVELSGTHDGWSCTDAVVTIPVSAANAAEVTYRLRLIPGDQSAPVQDKIVVVKGGGPDWPLGELSLEQGLDASGTVSGTTMTALPAYLRAIKIGGDGFPDTETFSDSSGVFPLRLMPGSYDVLVVPQQNVEPPVLVSALSPDQIANGLVVPPATAITGTVLDASGTPVNAASVSMRDGVVPSTIGTTDSAGAFTVQLHPGVSTSVSVSPPSGSGLPGLELAAGAWGSGGSGPLTVQYAAIATRALAITITESDGSTPSPGARITFVARTMANAGTVTPQGGSALPASGRVRVSAVADGSGAVNAVLPEAVYDVVTVPAAGAPANQAPSLTTIDLTGANPTPTSVSLATPATLTGVVSEGASVLENIRVTAVPRGLLGNLVPTVTAMTGADGMYTLALVGGGEYDLTFESGAQTHGGARQTITAPAAGASGTAPAQELSAALPVAGTLSLPGSGAAAGVTVILLCHLCSGMEAQTPIAVAVTDSTGRFRLAVPDPGVEDAP